ncbi:hypothetical protein IMSAGC013_04473 [Lachnospiraceae bacterium]|jgi:hypothetical protein|nr:hypothetical protein IMSAGC013_04473 [Lachnospiraceae bacterium]
MDALLTLRNMEDIKISNDTKIKYLSVADTKIYKVTNIDFCNLTIEAKQTDLNIGDVPESELWDISYFEDFRVRLVNGSGKAEIIDMEEWLERNKKE